MNVYGLSVGSESGADQLKAIFPHLDIVYGTNHTSNWPRDLSIAIPQSGTHLISDADLFDGDEESGDEGAPYKNLNFEDITLRRMIPFSTYRDRQVELAIPANAMNTYYLPEYTKYLKEENQKIQNTECPLESGNILFCGEHKEKVLVSESTLVKVVHHRFREIAKVELPSDRVFSTISDLAYWAAFREEKKEIDEFTDEITEEKAFEFTLTEEQKQTYRSEAEKWEFAYQESKQLIRNLLEVKEGDIAFLRNTVGYHLDLEILPLSGTNTVFLHSPQKAYENLEFLQTAPPPPDLTSITAEITTLYQIASKVCEENQKRIREIGLNPAPVCGAYSYWAPSNDPGCAPILTAVFPLNGLSIDKTVILFDRHKDAFRQGLVTLTAMDITPHLPQGYSIERITRGHIHIENHPHVSPDVKNVMEKPDYASSDDDSDSETCYNGGGLRCFTNELFGNSPINRGLPEGAAKKSANKKRRLANPYD